MSEWSDQEFIIHAFWTPRDETAQGFRSWLDLLQAETADHLGLVSWRTASPDADWPESATDQLALIEASIDSDDEGGRARASGFSVHLWENPTPDQAQKSQHGSLRVTAGSTYAPSRMPADRIVLNARETPLPSLPAAVKCLESVIRRARPMVATLTDLDVYRVLRRAGWLVPAARWIWIHESVGTFEAAGTGFETQDFEGGTLARCPDDWSAQQVSDAGMALIMQSGVAGEVAH